MDNIKQFFDTVSTDARSLPISEYQMTIAHSIIVAILVYCLWRRHSLILATLLLGLLVFLALYNRYPPHLFLLLAIIPSICDLAFIKMGIHKYTTTQWLPLWMVPLWGIIGYYMLTIADVLGPK